MKKILGFLFLCIGVVLFFIFIWGNRTQSGQPHTALATPTKKSSQAVKISQSTLFVPYWTLDSLARNYDEYIYFGISPTEKGIDTTDEGYKGIPSFVVQTQGHKTLLTLRMLDTSFSSRLFQDEDMQEKIIRNTLQVASNNGFDGIVLDLEYSGLAFPTVTKSITDFSIKFAKEAHGSSLSFYQVLYGDTFYLARPYNVKDIAQQVDGIFVLSYDFHKANGTPGPNFPMSKSADSDYTFLQMLSDFSKDVPKEKLIITFGMFGYDWVVDDKGRSIGSATSLSTNEALKKFIGTCNFKSCEINSNKFFETQATYIDVDKEKHEVWFEDLSSVERKEEVLQQNGISKIGFWANGYF
ncbi:MAG TPA: glycosyl hydrolase family 18 protein [Candidatus Eisenbacteria bacterium]|nr:glycosyl hydrolase family 18 protein [Candidatus Eisenbacteria bacterium]